MTPEAAKFIEDLKTIDYSIAMWAEVKLDAGHPLADVRERLYRAMMIAHPLRQEGLIDIHGDLRGDGLLK